MTFHGVPIPYTDRADWLARRREGIGASDVAAILELSPYSSPFSVWADKTQGAEKEQTAQMRGGKRMERVIEEELAEEHGIYVGARELLVRHPTETWAMATVDGLAFESPPDIDDGTDDWGMEPLANVEFKTDGSYGRWDEVPDHYQIQTQWQMWVEGLDQTILACLHGGRLPLEIYEISADPIVQQKMVDKVSAWREKYLLDPDAEPPEVDAHPATARVIADLWSEATDEEVELNQAMYAEVQLYRVAKQRESEATAEVQRLKNRIAAHMQEASIGTWAGKPILTYKQRTVKEHVRKESTFRVLKLIEEK